jgi:hypothetical protein
MVRFQAELFPFVSFPGREGLRRLPHRFHSAPQGEDHDRRARSALVITEEAQRVAVHRAFLIWGRT